jgi:hypothetical protein
MLRMADQLVDERQVRTPVAGKTREMRNDEVHV